MVEQKLIEKITNLKILKEKRKVKININNTNNTNIAMIIIKKEAEAIPF